LEVIANDLGEESGVGFGGVRAGDEIGDGDAGFVGVHTDCCTKPILSVRGCSEETEENQEEENLRPLSFDCTLTSESMANFRNLNFRP